MTDPLIPIHVLAGLAGSLIPFWIVLEMLKPIKKVSLNAVKVAAFFSLVLITISWITGGTYYVDTYGPDVKPAIKESQPWIHLILMESKEHIFLFLPFLAALLNVLLWSNLKQTKGMVITVAITLVILGILMTIFGLMITGAREAAGVIV